MIVVQRVSIRWTKATRGAPRANERAALPRAFAVESVDSGFLYQRYAIDEDDGFRPALRQREASATAPQVQDGMLWLTPEPDGTLMLGLVARNYGQPLRAARPRALRLPYGQWARLSINARHAYNSGQFYTEDVYNVAFAERVEAHVFTAAPPQHVFSQMADLF